MPLSLPTTIYRHRKENTQKCSLRGLEHRDDFSFFTYPKENLPDLSSYFVLKMGAPPLSSKDSELGILLIDATWRYAETMFTTLPPSLEERSIPEGFQTAYPRKQTDCPDPSAGLASIEALYITFLILGKDTENLLDTYYWKNTFLEINASLLAAAKKKQS